MFLYEKKANLLTLSKDYDIFVLHRKYVLKKKFL